MRPKLLLALASAALVLAPNSARGDENLWGYSYGADTLPQGAFEMYSWLTWRHGKNEGDYEAFDLQLEFEYGITDRFSTSTYLTFDGRDQHGLDEDEFDDIRDFRWNGIKQAFKYNLLSTYKDPVGLSFYVEPGWSRFSKVSGEREDEIELETKLILQKNFLDDTLALALNISPEFEWEFTDDEGTETEFILEVTAGASYRFAPRWFAGLEIRYHTEFPEYESQEHQAVFLGPTLHYGGEKWWATLTVLPQIWGEPNEGGSHRHFEEHEAVEVRLKVGYNF